MRLQPKKKRAQKAKKTAIGRKQSKIRAWKDWIEYKRG